MTCIMALHIITLILNTLGIITISTITLSIMLLRVTTVPKEMQYMNTQYNLYNVCNLLRGSMTEDARTLSIAAFSITMLSIMRCI